MKPEFDPHPRRDGLRITDRVERVRFDLYTDGPVEPTDAETDAFPFPVDSVATVRTGAVRLPELTDVFVRTPAGDLVTDAKNGHGASVPAGRYVLEIGGSPVKLYLAVESRVTVRPGDGTVRLDLGGPTSVTVGARSKHERPAGTVTVTDDPGDAMAAISTFGSALKTTSPERSFPTLRGHPPTVVRGDRFAVPEGVDPPDTGVTIEVPPEYEYVYPVASLAYYLGASVVPGAAPRVVAGDVVRSLAGPDGFERAVERTLKQQFFLDCVTRTEGLYDVDLKERRVVEPRVDLDFAALYDRPLAGRVAAYLDVPFRAVADQLPAWRLTMDVAADPASVEVLPFAANDLAVVRCPPAPDGETTAVAAQPPDLAAFYRGPATRSTAAGTGGGGTDVVRPNAADTLEHAWFGDGAPLGASKASVPAATRRAERSARPDADIRVTVVCNDPEMRAEGLVERLYGDRAGLDFDVSLRADLTTAALRRVLESDVDFLHYVGHVDDTGMQCADGFLDARSVESVGVGAFVLNACRSYDQGLALVEAGSVAGVVTVRAVGNRGATRIGRTFARLLNRGFSLRSSLSIAREESLLGNNYLVVGDGNATLVQCQGQVPVLLEVEPAGGAFQVTMFAFPTTNFGGFITPNVGDNRTRYLNAGRIDSFVVSAPELDRFLSLELFPVRTPDGLVWSDRVDAAFFTDRRSRPSRTH